jgi:hypothetical protein
MRKVAAWDFAPPARDAAKLCIAAGRIPANMLKDRVLFTSSEFHSGAKHATTWQGASVAPTAARFAFRAIVVGLYFEV